MSELGDVVKALHAQVEDLKGHLEAVGQLKDRALDAFPIVEENINILTTKFTAAVEQASSNIEDASKSQTEVIRLTLDETHRAVRESLEQTSQAIDKEIKAIDEQMQQEISRTIEAMGRNLAPAIRAAS